MCHRPTVPPVPKQVLCAQQELRTTQASQRVTASNSKPIRDPHGETPESEVCKQALLPTALQSLRSQEGSETCPDLCPPEKRKGDLETPVAPPPWCWLS